jgi:hypothetical protein
VTDATAATVSGAELQVVNPETGLRVTTISNDEGAYQVPSLPPGRYIVSANKAGFKRAEASDIQVRIQEQARVNFVLELGSVTDSVSVTAEAMLLNADSTSLGTVVERRSLVELPVSGRNLSSLTLLGPGMTSSRNGISQATAAYTTGGVTLSANGMRTSTNQFSVDGANVNSGFYNVPSFVPVVDAVEEFRVQSGSYSAEFGGFGGAHVNYSLKSGTNQIHGSVWEFFRNDKLDARNAFSPTKPPFRQNQYGGILSGPIVKNRLFYMGSYEGYRQRRQSIGQGTVPTEAQRRGDLSRNTAGVAQPAFTDPLSGSPFPGNIIPANRISPTAQKALAFYPLPNQAGAVNYRSETSIPTDRDSSLVKMDFQISDKNRLSARYALMEADLPGGTTALFGDFGTRNPLRSQNASVLDTHMLSPSTLLDIRLSWNRMLLLELSPRSNSDFDARTALDMVVPSIVGPGKLENGFPNFQITGYATLGDSTVVPLKEPDENYQLVTGISTLRGKHSIKFGVDLRRARSVRVHGRNTNGTLVFDPNNLAGSRNAFADFLLGLPRTTSFVDRSVVVDMRQFRAHSYFADTWNIHPKLTLDLGIRYEFNTPVSEPYGRIPVFSFDAPGGFRVLEPGEALFRGDYNNWAPRVGLVYRPTDRTVVRSSFGIFYSEPKRHGMNVRGINPPFIVSQSFFSAAGMPLSSSNAWPIGLAAAGGVPAPVTFDPNARTPYVEAWSFNVQRMLPANILFEVGYVGNHAIKMGRQMNLNIPMQPGPGAIQARRPLPDFGPANHFQYDSNSSYNALQLRGERRFGGGLSFLASYTFGRSVDLSGDELSGGTVDPRNLNIDRGLSDMHVAHRASVSYVWELPFGRGRRLLSNGGPLDFVLGGWQFSGITVLESGSPFTITAPGDIANVGLASRPDRLCDGRLDNRSADMWFDTSCFAAPRQFTFGNSGRNILTGPGTQTWDVGIMKRFRIVENHTIQFRAEMFNSLNHVNLGNPGTSLGTPSFGRILGSNSARSIQLGLKYGF